MSHLTMSQWYAIVTPHGYRCPYCDRFRRLEDFEEQPAAIDWRSEVMHIHIHVAPACRECSKDD